ncbi:hypothetical protein [Geobacter sp.]|uniref:hypothetical protein n=1 Tax=Geobacter sp. TaxID=46610 RepID=UPI00260916AD|nr:hypothetical protein [Geobacter sp.]
MFSADLSRPREPFYAGQFLLTEEIVPDAVALVPAAKSTSGWIDCRAFSALAGVNISDQPTRMTLRFSSDQTNIDYIWQQDFAVGDTINSAFAAVEVVTDYVQIEIENRGVAPETARRTRLLGRKVS